MMKTFTIRTKCHDSCGEPVERTVDICHLDDVVLSISLEDLFHKLWGRLEQESKPDMSNIREHPLYAVHRKNERQRHAINQVLRDKGIFTNKWDSRSSWFIKSFN